MNHSWNLWGCSVIIALLFQNSVLAGVMEFRSYTSDSINNISNTTNQLLNNRSLLATTVSEVGPYESPSGNRSGVVKTEHPAFFSVAYQSGMELLLSLHEQLRGELCSTLFGVDRDSGLHVMSDVGYAGTRYKGLWHAEENGSNFLLSSYYSKLTNLLGVFMSGGNHQYNIDSNDGCCYTSHGRNKLIGGGVFGRWSSSDFWLAGAVQVGVNNFSNEEIDDSSNSLAYAAHCEAGYNHLWTTRMGANLYTSFLYAHIASPNRRVQDQTLYHHALASKMVRIGGHLYYNFNDPKFEDMIHVVYIGAAYEHEFGAKLDDPIFGRDCILPANSCALETGYNLQFKGWRIKLRAASALAKLRRANATLAVGYSF